MSRLSSYEVITNLLAKSNLSTVDNSSTARTCPECADQRAENLACLGSKNILELCVGPSLPQLERSYAKYGMSVTGNDIEARWRAAYRQGKWIVGDALNTSYDGFDTIVFAPPLSRGCTGARQDSLSIEDVNPSYSHFLNTLTNFHGIVTLVLPGRTFATSIDREQYYNLISRLQPPFDVVPLYAGVRKITKYHDIYIQWN